MTSKGSQPDKDPLGCPRKFVNGLEMGYNPQYIPFISRLYPSY